MLMSTKSSKLNPSLGYLCEHCPNDGTKKYGYNGSIPKDGNLYGEITLEVIRKPGRHGLKEV